MNTTLRPLAYTVALAACMALSLTVLPAQQTPSPGDRDARRVEAFQRAYVLERQQNYAAAIDALRTASRENHGYLAEIRLAWLYYYAGNYANSRREFALAARQSPGAIEPWACVQLPLLAQQRYDDVEQATRQVMALDPSHYYSNLRQSYACRLQGKYSPAEKVNRRMLTLYPTDLSFLLEQSLTLIGQGASDQARPYLLDVLRVSPSNAYARQMLTALASGAPPVKSASLEAYAKAAQLETEGHYHEAIKLLGAITPERSEAYFLQLRLGWLNYLAAEYELSQRHYERAANLAPKAVEPLLGLLMPLLAANKLILTEMTAREIMELDPKNYTANLRLGYALRLQQRYAEAEKVIAGMLPLYPSDISLLLELGLSIDAQGRNEVARGYYQQVRLLSPENPTALAALALPFKSMQPKATDPAMAQD